MDAILGSGSYDRARGGQVQIFLTIPGEVLAVVSSTGGTVTVPPKTVQFEIDLDRMPLVNVAGYRITGNQVSPPYIPYPYGFATVNAFFV